MAENAKPRDVQEGWRIFRSSGYTADLDVINAELERTGFNPVSLRTMAHYRKLFRNGYVRYVPINQLDVETLRDPVWDTPLRHRYLPRRADLDVSLIFLRKVDDLVILSGRVRDLSDLEALIILTPTVADEWLEGGSPAGKQGLVILPGQAQARSVYVENYEAREGEFELTVSFLEVVPTDAISARQALAVTEATLTAHVDESQYLLNTVRTLNMVTTALESVRIACDEALGTDGDTYALTAPELRSMSRENPVQLVIAAPVPVVLGFIWLVRALLRLRQQWHIGSVTRGQAEINEAQANLISANADRINELTRQERASGDVLGSPEVLNAIARQFASLVSGSLQTAGATRQPDPTAEVSARLLRLVEHQVLPSAERLLDQPIDSIDTETSLPVPEVELWPESGEADNQRPSTG